MGTSVGPAPPPPPPPPAPPPPRCRVRACPRAGQCFLSMLCAMEWGVFIFFAAWVACMTVFVYFLVPETRGVPLEEM